MASNSAYSLPWGSHTKDRHRSRFPAGYMGKEGLLKAKRKRAEQDSDDDLDPDQDPKTNANTQRNRNQDQYEDNDSPNVGDHRIIALRTDEVAQYKLAGLDIKDPIPPAPFPVGTLPRPPNALEEAKNELETLQPPLYSNPLQGPAQKPAQRRHHIGVLNALVHALMLRQDYDRASRAWGLLLRALSNGTDVRNFGRWGIGAEIIMRRTPMLSRTVDGDGDEEMDDQIQPQSDDDGFLYIPEQNLEAAKLYYERLIIRYPPPANASWQENQTRANFFPAFFSVWLYQVSQRYRHIGPTRNELQEADAIEKRFDSIWNPPYSTDLEMCRLRRLVNLWLVDLITVVEDPHDAKEDLSKARGTIEKMEKMMADLEKKKRSDEHKKAKEKMKQERQEVN